MHKQLLHHALILSIKDQLDRGWDEFFVFDAEMLVEKARIGMKWVKTDQPVPFSFEMPIKEHDQRKEPSWREVYQKFKSFLPPSILKQQISAANALLRNAPRQGSFRKIDKAFNEWMNETAALLSKMFGRSEAETFLKSGKLPPKINPGTIQALQFLIEKKIDELSSL